MLYICFGNRAPYSSAKVLYSSTDLALQKKTGYVAASRDVIRDYQQTVKESYISSGLIKAFIHHGDIWSRWQKANGGATGAGPPAFAGSSESQVR